ncbi:TPA: hypothetical protein I7764_20405 [Vibrio vulnificus]|nr:hypothetical protein [Vibrio vulnificus]
MLALFDHKHASLFKKKANDLFVPIYLKKLLTVVTQLLIMRPVPNETAMKRKERNTWFWLRSSAG